MAELRRDPISGRWVVIATERGARPRDFHVPGRGKRSSGFCPFCEGNEDRTPPEIAAIRRPGSAPNTPGWRVRVVENKYPALQMTDPAPAPADPFYESLPGRGTHEVIIESPRHLISPTEMSPADFRLVVQTYWERERKLTEQEGLSYVLIFKNVGEAAGASVEHTHSQVIGLPVMPKRVEEELRSSRSFEKGGGRCLFCDVVDHELAEGSRVVLECDHFVAFCPFAARFPFEMCIAPKAHGSRFCELPRERIPHLAVLVQELIARLEVCLEKPPYNYLIHTGPVSDPDRACFHWHIELIPRVTRLAGFEWGTGCYINPMAPERAAQYLRDVPDLQVADIMTSAPVL